MLTWIRDKLGSERMLQLFRPFKVLAIHADWDSSTAEP